MFEDDGRSVGLSSKELVDLADAADLLVNISGLRAEIAHQLATFHRLMGSNPTHVDSHQHVHRREPIRELVAEIGNRLGVPVRQSNAPIKYLGEFYGQNRQGCPLDDAITVEHLIRILRALPDGTTELSCHPGLRGDASGMYVAEREREVNVLCDPLVRAAIQAEGIDLISFRDLASAISRPLGRRASMKPRAA